MKKKPVLMEIKVKYLLTTENWSGNFDREGKTPDKEYWEAQATHDHQISKIIEARRAKCNYGEKVYTGDLFNPVDTIYVYCEATFGESYRGGYYISIHGNDDLGCTRHIQSFEEATVVWNSLPEPMTFEWCNKNGFGNW